MTLIFCEALQKFILFKNALCIYRYTVIFSIYREQKLYFISQKQPVQGVKAIKSLHYKLIDK